MRLCVMMIMPILEYYVENVARFFYSPLINLYFATNFFTHHEFYLVAFWFTIYIILNILS